MIIYNNFFHYLFLTNADSKKKQPVKFNHFLNVLLLKKDEDNGELGRGEKGRSYL